MGVRAFVKVLLRVGFTELDWLRTRQGRSDLAVFHEFHEPPYGGGNQFLLALVGELLSRGLDVEVNRLSGGTPACLYNSFNFDFARLRRFSREGVRMVHRVDGPIGVYRGFDDGTDARIAAINELADVTIVQSRYSLEKHRELGLELRNPVVVHNAVDPTVFHPSERREAHERLRVISTSWSSNPRKGGDILAWLDRNLDFGAFEVTFAGNTEQSFDRIRVVPPLPSADVADLLRAHDVYLATSRDDPCSNALLEGLSCGLPAIYLDSGSNAEVAGPYGVAYEGDVDGAVAAITDRYGQATEALREQPFRIGPVADRYLAVLENVAVAGQPP
jgi:glycosyltransferase involved in cell wall biosynthesis